MKTFDLNISSDTIDIFIQNSKSLAHLKNIRTQKYEVTNAVNLEFFGMYEEDQLIGKTLRDVNKFMQEHWGTKIVDSIEDIENLVLKYNKPVSKKRNILFNRTNKLTILNMVKFPVLNDKSTVKSILTISEDITDKICPIAIYRSYRMFKQPQNAIESFLKHYEIQKYFDRVPSELELLALIEFANNSKKSSKLNKQVTWNYIDSIETKICNSNIQNITQKIAHAN